MRDPLHDAARTAVDPAMARRLALELFVAGYEGTHLPESYALMLEQGLAGVILFKRNFAFDADGAIDVVALTAHTGAVQAAAARGSAREFPVVCSIDQEGGAVQRLRRPFSEWPTMRDVGDRGDPRLAYAVGAAIGRECLAAGFNVDYAPVLDIDTNPNNPIIGRRAFGRDAETVVRMAGAFLDGLQSAGVLGCGKHFPGHGDTDADSHLTLPVLTHDLARLEAVELVPFRALANRMHLVMTAHVLYPALDSNLPATLSPHVLGPLLRAHCGFSGVIVSDDLEMKGVADVLDPGGCVRAGLAAGVDLFLVCSKRDVLEAGLTAAAEVFEAPIDDPARLCALAAVRRVRGMRARLQRPAPSPAAVAYALASPATRSLREVDLAGTLS
ncbi:MAG: beta-N-acetylhexosaminidase [Myxococcales bacterium]|nr:beta-N-acetylhexosaminidase [Myxococcales bacterium]